VPSRCGALSVTSGRRIGASLEMRAIIVRETITKRISLSVDGTLTIKKRIFRRAKPTIALYFIDQ
jgi:hypothetical protein